MKPSQLDADDREKIAEALRDHANAIEAGEEDFESYLSLTYVVDPDDVDDRVAEITEEKLHDWERGLSHALQSHNLR